MDVVKKFVRVRERNQVTLPGEIIAGLPIHPGDFLEMTRTSDGAIEIRPTRLIALTGTPDATAAEEHALQDVDAGRYETFSSAQEFAEDLKRRRTRGKKKVARAANAAAGD